MSHYSVRPARSSGRGQTRPVRSTRDRDAALAEMRARHTALIASEIRFLSLPR